MEGVLPMFSMMSISPHRGQPTVAMLLPSIQKAGQIPWPNGSLMRASMRPYCTVNQSCVFSRAEV